jgi:sulfonate transport system ATP-binding protein
VKARGAVQVNELTKQFGQHRVLDDLNLNVGAGEFVSLLGRSGSGKSTLLRILAGLDKEVSGDFEIPTTVSMAFQEPRLLPWRTVGENVWLGLQAPDRREVASRALDEVGLSEKEEAWPLTLSGGQAQRVSLARALVREPDLLLLDEPFGALDALTRLSMHGLVERLWRHHQPTVLLVTHDIDEALALSDRVLVLDAGHIVSEYPLPAERPRDHGELAPLRSRVMNDLGVVEHHAA